MNCAFHNPISTRILSTVILFLVFTFSSDICIAQNGSERDRLALLAFKSNITNDPFSALSSWNATSHFCQWRGVLCGRRHQRVIALDLSHQNLQGSISPSVSDLSFLRGLYLQNNSFAHFIPPQIGNLRRLRHLRLQNNSIFGEIPVNLSSCSSLVHLDVSYNKLVGNIPVELGVLSKLQVISVTSNNLTGRIPQSLGNLSSLVELSAGYNKLEGEIPVELGRLSRLEYLLFPVNRLSGVIPTTIFNLSSIRTFSLTDNFIDGSLPSGFRSTNLTNLEFFSIAGNQITGSIPLWLACAPNLAYVIVTQNRLSGKVPNLGKLHNLRRLVLTTNDLGNGEANGLGFISSLINSTKLEILALNDNSFGGELPESLANLSTSLSLLYLDNNRISERIPDGISRYTNLEGLEMWKNQLTGEIPNAIGRLQNLKGLTLNENRLSGNIPPEIGNLSMLFQLRLAKNSFSRSIPSSLGNLQNLQSLDISENNLTGRIPQKLFALSSLSLFFDLSNNLLTGSIPFEIGNLKNLGILDLSTNTLSGEIPSTLGSCERLEFLTMRRNLLQGTIPSSLSSMRGLRRLDLAQNNLSGEIPQFLGDFKLLRLNLSFNDFHGALPEKGIFKNASAMSVKGNANLCGGIYEMKLPRCKSKKSQKITSTFIFRLIISIASGLVGLILISTCLYIYWYRKKKDVPTFDSSINLLEKISYRRLFQATNGFSSDNLIGVGSYGTVYQGVLDQGGTQIAVKVLNLMHPGAAKSFQAECEAFKNIKHRNLVKVLTVCSGLDYKGKDFKALVCELMGNGNLDSWLHPLENNEESKKLSFLQRLKIAIDIAHALDYLHNHCQTSIVHCDLKPSNVLLDNELVGHVGDFGLAKILAAEDRNFSEDKTSSMAVRGTVGYAAPEYGMGNEVLIYGDVYSFGIVLLEMFTGKRPTDEMFKGGLDLHKMVKAALPDHLAEVTDPLLVKELIEDATDFENLKFEECLISIFEVGIACSKESGLERMRISDAAAELSIIRQAFLKIQTH